MQLTEFINVERIQRDLIFEFQKQGYNSTELNEPWTDVLCQFCLKESLRTELDTWNIRKLVESLARRLSIYTADCSTSFGHRVSEYWFKENGNKSGFKTFEIQSSLRRPYRRCGKHHGKPQSSRHVSTCRPKRSICLGDAECLRSAEYRTAPRPICHPQSTLW